MRVLFCRLSSGKSEHFPCSQNFILVSTMKGPLLKQGGHIVAKMKFPEFSLCYINFPCVIFTEKLTIHLMNKGHITTVLLHTEA